MMIAMTAFAVVAAIMRLVGFDVVEFTFSLLSTCVLPVVVGTLALYSRGYRQTFFLGASAGYLIYLTHIDEEWSKWLFGHVGLLLTELIIVASGGFTALYTRRFLERRGWHLPPSDDAG